MKKMQGYHHDLINIQKVIKLINEEGLKDYLNKYAQENLNDMLTTILRRIQDNMKNLNLTRNLQLKLINTMEVIDIGVSGNEVEYVLVEDNEANRDILNQVGLTDTAIDVISNKKEKTLNIVEIGFKYGNIYHDGEFKYIDIIQIKEGGE